MNKSICTLLILAACAALAFSQDSEVGSGSGIPGFSSYRPIYGVVGWGNRSRLESNDLVLVNISFKYDPFYRLKLGFYMGYTQTMYWALFDESGPFKELNYRPEAFFRFESGNNFANDVRIPLVDYLQLGWEHRSNGQDGDTSRGWDRMYAQLQLGFGETVHFAGNIKYFRYFEASEVFGMPISVAILDNPDIEDYTGNFEFQIIANLNIPVFPLKIALSGGPGGGRHAFDFMQGWQQLDVYFLKLAGNLRPYLQIWHGYGQSIEDYNESDFNAHAGIAIEM